ncbi:MAG: tetratricopeptide repeat protein, partial [Candidatus Krumholzibacteria bacterium]|nr:tetratricopeptide repeat protein [Candidatus Krumholzibacteria bacterium]
YEPAGREGGELLAAAGQPKRALAWFEELLGQQDVDDRSAIYVLAVEAAYAAGDDGAVARLSDDYATRYPETFAPQMAYTRARSALRTGRHAQALEEANRIEQIAVGTEWARAAPRLRGGAYLGMGEPARAIDELSLFVAISSDSAARCDVLKEIAQVGFTAARDTTAALDALERLLDVERRALPGEMLSVALAYEGAGRFGDAARHHRDLAARHPLSEEAAEAEARLAFLDEFAVTDYAAAVAALDGRISEIAGAGAKGLLLLVEARVEVLKDFEGALALCERIEKGTKVDETRTHATYLRGLCHAKMARRALGARGGKDAAKTARDHAKRADAAWKDLSGGGSPWAVAAAFERALLEADLDRVDVAAAEALMNAHPEAPESARLAERLGDHFAESASNEDLARAAAFYERAARARPDSPALSLKLATARARAGRCEEALPELERIARDQRSRTGLRASYEAGACLRELKRPREAAPYFDRVAQRDPNGNFGTGAMLQAGDCFYLQRDFEGALDRYARAGRAAPSEARRWEAGYRAGLALRGLGRDADALARFQACVASDQGGASRPRAYQNAVETAGALGDGDRQVALIETWITEFRPEESAESAAAAATLARLYLERDQAKEALALAQRLARAGDKDAAEPRALEAMALYRLGRTGDADQARARVVTLAGAESPLVQEIGVEAARYHYDAKRFAEAAAAVRPFAESCSGEGACEGARYLYALALFGAQQMEKGSAVAQSFFRDYPLSPRTSTLHLRMGNVLAASGRPNEAVIHYREAVETTRDDATAFDALKNLGLTYHKMERWRDAEQVWYQVLSRYGDRPYATEAALNVGRCRMERGDYAGAIDAYEKSLPLLQGEDRARAFYWMGQSYEQLGDYQSAVVEYLKVPYLSSAGGMWVVTAQLQAAQCYARIERPEAAREIYEKVIRAHGAGSSWGKLAQKGLDALRAPSGEGSGGSGP